MKKLMAALALATLVPALSGCVGGSEKETLPADDLTAPYVDLTKAVFNTTGSWSQTLKAGIYGRLEPVIQLVPSFDGTEISIGIFRPDIPDCPTEEATDYPDRCKTPVILDAGPYYSPVTVGVESTRPPTAIWFVPHGYTVVQMAIRGTGGSGGCMELMSPNEQKDVDAIITDLAGRAWSNGNVAMMGRSYDGTTPFMGAALGNPHLKTIVPISGVADMADLMFSNGTSEFRGPIMHNVVYWLTYGIQAEPMESKSSQACAEVAKGTVVGAYTAVTGDASVAGQDPYWELRRFREPILANYNGSMFIVHGMQDWNVNPRMVVPWINDLQDAGITVKAWLGQWGHAYPDRPDEHPNVRWDWAETLLRWFDHELKGAAVDTGPIIEVEDHRHQWWTVESYPSHDLSWLTFHLNADGTMTSEPGAAGMDYVANPFDLNTVDSNAPEPASISLTSEPIPGPVRVSGLVQLPISVTPTTSWGGNLYAQLYDVYPDGRSVWIGHAWMNLRYHEGTTEQQPLVPGRAVKTMMQFEPLEAYLADGHRLRLTLHQGLSGGNADTLPNPEGGPIIVNFGPESQLLVPLLRDFVRSPYSPAPSNP